MEIQVPSSHSKHRFTILQKFAILAVALFSLWMYAPALQLPLSVIDDYSMLRNLDRWKEDIREHGIRYAVQHDISVDQKVYNTGFWILEALQFSLTGGQPFHWLRLAELGLVSFLLFRLIYVAGEKRRGAIWAAIAFTIIFLVAEVPGSADLQALRINWYRQFASDADALVYVSLFLATTFAMLRGFLNKRFRVAAGWAVAAVVAACVAFTMKIPFFAVIIVTLATLSVAAFLCGERRFAICAALVMLVIVGAFGAYNVVLRKLHIEKADRVYAENYSFAPAHVWSGFKYYLHAYWSLYGPLFVAVCAAVPWALLTGWRRRYEQHKYLFICLVGMILFTGCAFGLYLPWNSRLPRYMLVGVFGFNVIAGITAMLALQGMSEIRRDHKLWLLLLPVGAGAVFLPRWILLAMVAIAAAGALFRYARAGIPFLSGVAIVGMVYIVAVAPAVRTSAKYVYVHREKANWEMTMTLLKFSAQNRTMCFAGNIADEHLGSMVGLVDRMGILPRLYSVNDKAKCGPNSLILIHRWLSSADAQNFVGNRHMIKEIGAVPGGIPVPVSFWDFKRRLGEQTLSESMVNYWQTDYIWRLYE